MSNLNEIPDTLARAVPGLIGSLVSMLFIKDTFVRRVGMFVAGAALAHFGTPWASRLSDLDYGFAGFLLGLFGMVAVSKAFDTWQTFELTLILRDWIRKVLGLPAKEGA